MRLRDLREDREVSQQELAELLNIRQSTYSHYETGIRQPSIETLIKLAYFYDTSLDYLVGITDDPKPYSRRWPKEYILPQEPS